MTPALQVMRTRGLSPLARGTLVTNYAKSLRYRFIPAGAGNTQRHEPRQLPAAVYPRWRGEHKRTQRQQFTRGGLSPLARGTHIMHKGITIGSRFIPAGAGNTSPGERKCYVCPVYPRWRGEHAITEGKGTQEPGLSPLARGTRQTDRGNGMPDRFIPAGAGNTGC